VQEPIVVDRPDQFRWDDEADVVITGFGGAGVCAAIEAAERGASVIALDRFDGGGATAMSGGSTMAAGRAIKRRQDLRTAPATSSDGAVSTTVAGAIGLTVAARRVRR
jgi:succinate dehydrogenase/fumarate reductase flavoprotein subunit